MIGSPPSINSVRYVALEPAIAGGMGSIIPCLDKVLERKVAIKVMPGDASRRRMRDEVAALLKLRSKHVVQVYDILKLGDNDLGIVQEFIDGCDLVDESLAPQSLNDYLKLAWQISAGIADIHEIDLIHRDIKPNNMKADLEGVIKIFDFGLAREEGSEASTTGFVGTPGFAAPELYAGDARFTTAVDTYAFGATALFLALRRLPRDLMQRPPKNDAGTNHFTDFPFALADEVAITLNGCLNPNAAARPKMRDVRDVLAKHLLMDRHRALVVLDAKAIYLDATRRTVKLGLRAIGEVAIRYDGFSFRIDSVSGDVFVNNRMVELGDELPGACVVALGGPEIQSQRRYITFDLSHPEIVL